MCENLKRYTTDKTKLQLKYIFLEGVNDNASDVDGFYEIAKETGGIVTFSADLNKPFTEKMRELALHTVEKAKADGIRADSSSSYLTTQDAKFISESYAKVPEHAVSA